jgi:PhoH-like ATPase
MSDMVDKYFVLDSNLFVLDPDVMLQFEPKNDDSHNHVVIPAVVLEELDNLKQDEDELGKRTERARNAQQALSKLEEIITRSQGSLHESIALGDRYSLMTFNEYTQEQVGKVRKMGLNPNKRDNILLMIAEQMQKKLADSEVQLVTEDKGLLTKASSLGVNVQNWKGGRVVSGVGSETKLYWGHRKLILPLEAFEELDSGGKKLKPSDIDLEKAMLPWEFATVFSKDRGGKILAYFDPKQKAIVNIYKEEFRGFPVTPKNDEQRFAAYALLNPEVQLVHLLGRAGTGKTFLALAAGISQLKGVGAAAKIYSSVMVMRPPEPAGKQLGYLPGSKEEKLEEWMQPIHDNWRVLQSETKLSKTDLAEMKNQGLYSEQAHYSIRGRSIDNAFIIVDEAQNLTPREIKLIVTRAAHGTKIILTGDPYQIDHQSLGRYNNGLVYSSERMKREMITATVHLEKVERGPLAEAASRLL